MVVVDTEEEFDWSAPHDPRATNVSAMRALPRAQAIFDQFGVRPAYVADYPVVTQPAGSEPLLEIHEAGRCEIGAHLHPWVTPPLGEPSGTKFSFPGNLPYSYELAKLTELTASIEHVFGARPIMYKAGRYGLGPHTADILEVLGYRIDLSPTPGFDYSGHEGPDYSSFPNTPFWFGTKGNMLCAPCTGAFVGSLASSGRYLYPLAHKLPLRHLKVPGILARLRMLERIRLSPEGFSLDDMIRLTHALLSQGIGILTLSFHSPSLSPGFTPYVRSPAERDAFLGKIQGYLEYFSHDLGGCFTSPGELYQTLRARRRPTTSRGAIMESPAEEA